MDAYAWICGKLCVRMSTMCVSYLQEKDGEHIGLNMCIGEYICKSEAGKETTLVCLITLKDFNKDSWIRYHNVATDLYNSVY